MDRSVPAGAAILLRFIYETETSRTPPACYDVIYGHNQAKLPKPVTAMTLDQVIAAQRGWSKRYGSSATGAAQFMRATLTGLKDELGLRGTQLMDGDLQDRLAYHLLLRRGYADFMNGTISRIEFGKRLAMEWASFPVLAATWGAHRALRRGQSYYAGDGVNKALVKPEKVEALLDGILADARKATAPVPPSRPQPPPQPDDPGVAPGEEAPEPVSRSKRFWTWLTTGGGTAVLPFVDWRVQALIVIVVVGFAIYAIATMPAVRSRLGLA